MLSDKIEHGGAVRPRGRRWRGSSRGAVLVEYAFLLVAVGIPTMAGISLGGARMYSNYNRARAAILANTP